MANVKLSATYLDLLAEHDDVGLFLINVCPSDGQTNIPASDAARIEGPVEVSCPLYLSLAYTGSSTGITLTETIIYVTINGGTPVQVYDGSAFDADWTDYSTVAAQTYGDGPNNHEQLFVLIRNSAFSSLDEISVNITGNAEEGGVTLDETYSFIIEDLTKPTVTAVRTRGLKKLRVTFSEAVEQNTGNTGDALLIRDISSSITVTPQETGNAHIVSSRNLFTGEDVGRYIGIAGAENSANNDIFEILSLVSTTEIEIDSTAVVEEFLEPSVLVTIAPYKVKGVPDTSLLSPYFEPVVIDAETISTTEIELTLHTDITQNRLYNFYASSVWDLNENEINTANLEFTTEALSIPKGRVDEAFSMVDMIPPANLEEDTTGDLTRLLQVLDEPLQLMLYDIDRFSDIMDIDLVDDSNLDAMLNHYGNPFSFAYNLESIEKRRLIDVLVASYKKKGTEVGLENLANYVLGITIDIQPARDVDGQWVLGVGQLGSTSILGPGHSYLLYSFDVEVSSPITGLTDNQRLWLVEMIEWGKPAHTHFIRLIEPGGVVTWPS